MNLASTWKDLLGWVNRRTPKLVGQLSKKSGSATFELGCDLPGHREWGMLGSLVVTE